MRLTPLLIEQMIFVRIPSQHTLQHLKMKKIKVNASLCLRLYFVGTPKYTCESTSKKRADTLPARAALALSPFPRTLISIGQKTAMQPNKINLKIIDGLAAAGSSQRQ